MKRLLRPLMLTALCVVLAIGAYAAASGDSLVTLSHLTNTISPQMIKDGTQAAEKMLDEVYHAAKAELDRVHNQTDGGDPGQTGDSAPNGSTLQPIEWYDGQTISFGTGSGLLMLEGAATVTHNGALVDVTSGTEIPSGSELKSSHRYLVGEETRASVTVLSGYGSMGVQGDYTVSGGRGNPVPFADVKQGDWYYEPVNYVYTNQLFSGVDIHQFAPHTPMTRAMLMTVLYKVAGAPEEELNSAEITLVDVPDHAWYAPYVKWGVVHGIASGTGEGRFSPDGQLTREQMATMLYSFSSQYLKKEMAPGADLSGYPDQGQVSEWAVQAMSWAVGQGIISGSSNGGIITLNPKQPTTRAEVAAMLKAFNKKI